LSLSQIYSLVEAIQTILSSYPWKLEFCSNFQNYWPFHQFVHSGNYRNNVQTVRAYLDILSAKGCELVLNRVFSYPVEIFSSSIWVTVKPQSIFLSCWNIQDFNMGQFNINLLALARIPHNKGIYPSQSIFNNNKWFNWRRS
jgi:hypothetical protein